MACPVSPLVTSKADLQGHPEEVYGCEFLDASAKSMRLATCSEEKVYLWDVASGRQLDSAGPPTDIQHEPDGVSQ